MHCHFRTVAIILPFFSTPRFEPPPDELINPGIFKDKIFVRRKGSMCTYWHRQTCLRPSSRSKTFTNWTTDNSDELLYWWILADGTLYENNILRRTAQAIQSCHLTIDGDDSVHWKNDGFTVHAKSRWPYVLTAASRIRRLESWFNSWSEVLGSMLPYSGSITTRVSTITAWQVIFKTK